MSMTGLFGAPESAQSHHRLRRGYSIENGPGVAPQANGNLNGALSPLTFGRRLRLSRVSGSAKEMTMKNSCESLFGIGLAILALLMLLTVTPTRETSRSPLIDNKASVSEVGLRAAMQR